MKKLSWIVLVILGVFLLVGCGDAATQATPTVTPAVIATDTPQPTPTDTAQPIATVTPQPVVQTPQPVATVAPVSQDKARFGGKFSTFVKEFGSGYDDTNAPTSYNWAVKNNTVLLLVDTPDGPTGTVTGLSVEGDNKDDVIAYCKQFLPTDAQEFKITSTAPNTQDTFYHSRVGAFDVFVMPGSGSGWLCDIELTK